MQRHPITEDALPRPRTQYHPQSPGNEEERSGIALDAINEFMNKNMRHTANGNDSEEDATDGEPHLVGCTKGETPDARHCLDTLIAVLATSRYPLPVNHIA